jgi:hypothetical protein
VRAFQAHHHLGVFVVANEIDQRLAQQRREQPHGADDARQRRAGRQHVAGQRGRQLRGCISGVGTRGTLLLTAQRWRWRQRGDRERAADADGCASDRRRDGAGREGAEKPGARACQRAAGDRRANQQHGDAGDGGERILVGGAG